MNVVWENVSIDDYLHSATSEENRIIVIWKWERKFFSDTKARKSIIDSVGKWHSIHMSDSFVPRYKDGKNPQDPDARIFTLSEYYPYATSEEKGKGAEAVTSVMLSGKFYYNTFHYHLNIDLELILPGIIY
jgi:hypothetical protein